MMVWSRLMWIGPTLRWPPSVARSATMCRHSRPTWMRCAMMRKCLSMMMTQVWRSLILIVDYIVMLMWDSLGPMSGILMRSMVFPILPSWRGTVSCLVPSLPCPCNMYLSQLICMSTFTFVYWPVINLSNQEIPFSGVGEPSVDLCSGVLI